MGSLDRDARGDRRRNFREATTVVARVTSGRARCDNNMRAMDELKALFGVPLIGARRPTLSSIKYDAVLQRDFLVPFNPLKT